jgi:multiple sugar transport system ATP-binding protein
MRSEISELQASLGVTMLYVTHDQVEAMTMGARVAVLRKGLLQQVDRPQAVYDRPTNLFVATFIGSPAMNLVRARLEQAHSGVACLVGDQSLLLPLGAPPELEAYHGRDVALGVRPEHVLDPSMHPDTGPTLRGEVQHVESLGPERLVNFEFSGDPVQSAEVREVAGDIDPEALRLLEREVRTHTVRFVARFDARSRVDVGEMVAFPIDSDHVHFFDLDSGTVIG